MTNVSDLFSITIIRDGPIVSSGGIPLIQRYPVYSKYEEPLAWDPVGSDDDEKKSTPEQYCLCRCGESNDKPFCDGTHIDVKFDDQQVWGEPGHVYPTTTFQGSGVTLIDVTFLCSGTGFCGTRYTTVWQMIEKTTDPEVLSRLKEMVRNCPSGRLLLHLENENRDDEPQYTPSIAAVPNGPLWVRGGIQIHAEDGRAYDRRNRVTLCRCGASNNKPFCDSTHEQIGFIAPLWE